MMNSLLTKIYNNYTIIYIQHSSNQLYIKNIIILSVHGTHNLLVFLKMAPKSMS